MPKALAAEEMGCCWKCDRFAGTIQRCAHVRARVLLMSQTTSITAFGAVPDGTTLNTDAIQRAIDQLAAGGGTVAIPAGTFLSGALFLKPGVNLHLEKGAVLKGSTDLAHYPIGPTRIEGQTKPWVPALVNADKTDHLRISGEGALDGSGKPFWETFWARLKADASTTNLGVPRPRLLFIQNSNDVRVSGIQLMNSGFWNFHLYRCRDVVIEGLRISAPPESPSTDGLDIDSSQDVTVRGCHFSVDDDCVAIKGSKGPFAMQDKNSPPVENIHIVDCLFDLGHGVLTLGSEATIVRNVTVERCKVAGPGTNRNVVVRLKLRPDTPQLYENITVKDITLDGHGSIFSIEPWQQYFDLQGQSPPARTIRNLTVSNVRGTFGKFGIIHGNDGDVIDRITMENIDVQLTNAPPADSAVLRFSPHAAATSIYPRLVGITNLVVKNVRINAEPYSPS
jgi:alpha-L-rhamnosidase